jgi:Leucine-rich repeat (LRR) protein
MMRVNRLIPITTLVLASLAVVTERVPAQDRPALETTLAWIKQVDGELIKPQYGKLTVAQLQAMQELKLGGHRKSDKKHLFVKPDEFRHLTVLTGLKKLNLGENDGVTDEALAHVGKLTGLRELILWDAPLTDSGLKHLRNLKELTTLDLAFATKISDAGLDDIAALSNLEMLNLAGTKVTDVSPLQKLTRLRELRLGKLKPRGIAELKKAVPAVVVK